MLVLAFKTIEKVKPPIFIETAENSYTVLHIMYISFMCMNAVSTHVHALCAYSACEIQKGISSHEIGVADDCERAGNGT